MNLQKTKRVKNKSYLEFIKGEVCCVFHQHSGQVVPHHCGKSHKGVGQKCDDTETVPLCVKAHAEVHQIGKSKFQEKYHVDFNELISICNAKYNKRNIQKGRFK